MGLYDCGSCGAAIDPCLVADGEPFHRPDEDCRAVRPWHYRAEIAGKHPWTGNPECYECGHEYEPLTGDGDGLCGPCYRGDREDDDAPLDTNREGDPALNGAFDKW